VRIEGVLGKRDGQGEWSGLRREALPCRDHGGHAGSQVEIKCILSGGDACEWRSTGDKSIGLRRVREKVLDMNRQRRERRRVAGRLVWSKH